MLQLGDNRFRLVTPVRDLKALRVNTDLTLPVKRSLEGIVSNNCRQYR